VKTIRKTKSGMSDIAIRIEHLSKMYRLGIINNGTLWKDIQTWMALKRGREDPHSRIGEDKYRGDDDHFWALKDISVDIKQGDRVGIIGKNGAGKSTLLKLLSRITAPTEGTIKIKGKIASLLEVGTGFHGELTGRENVYLNGAILGMKKRRITQKMDEIIAFSGIEQHIDTPVKRYSSGMFVRLAFAVAAHLDSDILIADEVLAVGDAEFQKKALGKMQDLSTGQGRTVLFVSHNIYAVQNLCNCGVILENGRIRARSEDITKLTAEYLYNPAKKTTQLKWINDGSIYNQYFTPLSMELQEENGRSIISEISFDKGYRVNLTYKIDTPHPLMFFFLTFHNADGTTFMGSKSVEYNDYEPRAGTYDSYFVIPPNTLNIKEFIISLSAHLRNTSYIIDGRTPMVFIKVTLDKYETSIKWHLIK
jgi:lipopolysaccharide transport system ATP-binding protein